MSNLEFPKTPTEEEKLAQVNNELFEAFSNPETPLRLSDIQGKIAGVQYVASPEQKAKLFSIFPAKDIHGDARETDPFAFTKFADHVTIQFQPEKGKENLDAVGQFKKVKILGEVWNDLGHALILEIKGFEQDTSNPKSILKYPHITMNCARNDKGLFCYGEGENKFTPSYVGADYSNILMEMYHDEAKRDHNFHVSLLSEPIEIDLQKGYSLSGVKLVNESDPEEIKTQKKMLWTKNRFDRPLGIYPNMKIERENDPKMPLVYFVRHAKTDYKEYGKGSEGKDITDEGEIETKTMAEEMCSQLDPNKDKIILTRSGLRRAKDTWEVMKKVFEEKGFEIVLEEEDQYLNSMYQEKGDANEISGTDLVKNTVAEIVKERKNPEFHYHTDDRFNNYENGMLLEPSDSVVKRAEAFRENFFHRISHLAEHSEQEEKRRVYIVVSHFEVLTALFDKELDSKKPDSPHKISKSGYLSYSFIKNIEGNIIPVTDGKLFDPENKNH